MLKIDRQAVEVAVHQSGRPEAPQLEVDLTGYRLTVRREELAKVSLERMLGAQKDLKPFYRLATGDPRLQPTVFEAVVNGTSSTSESGR